MNKTYETQNQESKTPFFLTNKPGEKPSGHLFFDNDKLVFEFSDSRPTIIIQQAKGKKTIEFVDDSSICIKPSDDPDTELGIFFPPDGKGRFVTYTIREWTGIDGTEARLFYKAAFLARFDSTGAKVVALWQLALPYTIFGVTFLLHSLFSNASAELDYFVSTWQWLALSPIVACHYLVLLVPGIYIVLCNRLWALNSMFLATLLLVAFMAACYFLPGEWQLLPPSETALIYSEYSYSEYWLVFGPYLLLLLLPAFYYLVVKKRY